MSTTENLKNQIPKNHHQAEKNYLYQGKDSKSFPDWLFSHILAVSFIQMSATIKCVNTSDTRKYLTFDLAVADLKYFSANWIHQIYYPIFWSHKMSHQVLRRDKKAHTLQRQNLVAVTVHSMMRVENRNFSNVCRTFQANPRNQNELYQNHPMLVVAGIKPIYSVLYKMIQVS